MQKNGEEIKLDVPARLVGDSRTLVPLRAISEAFGCRVEWDEALQKQIFIQSKIVAEGVNHYALR